MAALRNSVFLAAFWLAACGAESNQQSEEAIVTEPPADVKASGSPALASEPAEITAEDRARVCRAAIADLNGHSPEIMKVRSNTPDSVVVRYNRPDDGKAWTNECRFEGNRVIWRTIGAFGGNEPGRWRNSPADEDIRFAIDGGKVTITTTFSDGSSGSETYTVQ